MRLKLHSKPLHTLLLPWGWSHRTEESSYLDHWWLLRPLEKRPMPGLVLNGCSVVKELYQIINSEHVLGITIYSYTFALMQ